MLLPPINREAVNSRDLYLVIYTKDNGYTWRVMESQPTLAKTLHAIEILEEHREKNKAYGDNHLYKYDYRLKYAYTT